MIYTCPTCGDVRHGPPGIIRVCRDDGHVYEVKQ
jgi:predicted RNA-binding Zn-ribbon protein involved in translation (DUF1610 family)